MAPDHFQRESSSGGAVHCNDKMVLGIIDARFASSTDELNKEDEVLDILRAANIHPSIRKPVLLISPTDVVLAISDDAVDVKLRVGDAEDRLAFEQLDCILVKRTRLFREQIVDILQYLSQRLSPPIIVDPAVPINSYELGGLSKVKSYLTSQLHKNAVLGGGFLRIPAVKRASGLGEVVAS